MRKLFSAIRLARLNIRSAAIRAYLRLAFPQIRCHRTVRFGRGVVVQAFDGGTTEIGAGTMLHDGTLVLAHGGSLVIGKGCVIGRGSVIACFEHIVIGDGTAIAEHVTIRDQDHRHGGTDRLGDQGMVSAPIHIGHDVWLGAKVTITRGVEIAPHCVIGANAVVTRSATTRGLYAGAPARLVKPA